MEGGQWPIARWLLRYSVGLYEDLELDATLEPSVGDIRITPDIIIFVRFPSGFEKFGVAS